MKIYIISLAIMICGVNKSYAQFSEEPVEINHRKLFVGGNMSFEQSENRSEQIFAGGNGIQSNERSSTSFNPNVGYQLSKHWIFGVELGLSNSTFESEGTNGSKQKTTSIAYRFFSRYIINPEHKFKVYLNPYASLSKSKSELTFNSFNVTSTTEQTNNNFGISIGAQYNLASWIRITSNVGGFYHTTGTLINSNQEETVYSSTGFNFRGSSMFFGLEFLF